VTTGYAATQIQEFFDKNCSNMESWCATYEGFPDAAPVFIESGSGRNRTMIDSYGPRVRGLLESNGRELFGRSKRSIGPSPRGLGDKLNYEKSHFVAFVCSSRLIIFSVTIT
jgi:hypothetical protein